MNPSRSFGFRGEVQPVHALLEAVEKPELAGDDGFERLGLLRGEVAGVHRQKLRTARRRRQGVRREIRSAANRPAGVSMMPASGTGTAHPGPHRLPRCVLRVVLWYVVI